LHHVTHGTTATRAEFALGALRTEIFVQGVLLDGVGVVQSNIILQLRVTRVELMNEFSTGTPAHGTGYFTSGIDQTDRAIHAIAIVLFRTQIDHTRRRCGTVFKGTDRLFVDFTIGTVAFGNAMKVPADGTGSDIAIVGSTSVAIAIRIDISGTLVVRKKGRSWVTFLRGALAFGQGRITSGAEASGARIAKAIVILTRVVRKSGSSGATTTIIAIHQTLVTGSRQGVGHVRAFAIDLASLHQTCGGGVTRVGRAQVSLSIVIIGTSRETGLVMRGRNVARVTLARTKSQVTFSIFALGAGGRDSVGRHKDDGQRESKEEHHLVCLLLPFDNE
jgi:hypothetical protein